VLRTIGREMVQSRRKFIGGSETWQRAGDCSKTRFAAAHLAKIPLIYRDLWDEASLSIA